MFLDPKTYQVLHYAGSRVGQANLFKLLVGFVVFGHTAIQKKKTKNPHGKFYFQKMAVTLSPPHIFFLHYDSYHLS